MAAKGSCHLSVLVKSCEYHQSYKHLAIHIAWRCNVAPFIILSVIIITSSSTLTPPIDDNSG